MGKWAIESAQIMSDSEKAVAFMESQMRLVNKVKHERGPVLFGLLSDYIRDEVVEYNRLRDRQELVVSTAPDSHTTWIQNELILVVGYSDRHKRSLRIT